MKHKHTAENGLNMTDAGQIVDDHFAGVSKKVKMGSEAKASVKIYDALHFPPKSEQGELIELLKKAGKWEEISTLDAYALARIVNSKAWPGQLLEKLKKYTEIEQTERIYLGKIKQGDE